jgi:putative DNA primase/helicase
MLLWTAWGHQPDYHKRVEYLQEWVGVTLAGEATKHQVHTLLKGIGASGKSQVIDVVTALFPASTVISVEPVDIGRFDTAQFDGALLQVRADMATGTVDAGKMKSLQSGDAMQVEKKHKDGYVMRSRAGWLLSCNSSWRPSERDDSVYRRWTVLTFDRQVPEDRRVAGFAQTILTEELQGIIAWAVEGYQRFRANGHKYTKVPSSAAAISEWREDVEPMRQWVAECLGPQGTGRTKASTLYDNYVEWAKNSGCKNPFNKKNFGLELAKLGFQKKAASDANYYDVPLMIVAAGLPSLDSLLD